MSTPLQWRLPQKPGRQYCVQASGYTCCAIGGAAGWTFECWKGEQQLQVGLASLKEAKRWAQRHHDQQQVQGNRNANAESA